MSDTHILIERPAERPGVLVLRFNRPDKKNAITRGMYQTLTDAIRAANGDPDIRAIAFLGSPGAFSAGNDMADFMAFAMGGSLGREVLDFLDALSNAEKPLVSGVDGLAIGIGTTIHLHCDMTFATPRSLFRTPFVDLALVPEAASSLLGPLVMGHQRAFAMFAAGEGFSAEDARDAGLIWQVVPEEELEEKVLAAAAGLAAKPPQALRIARDLIRKGRPDVAGRIAEEAAHFSAQLKSAEAMAAFQKFMARKG
ncbi:crotonase/enoyl-CoA hydratase family protein [Gellertiella hungarica]|uniref:Enoyl-CoA hydratase/carnithine racemase n=1 Tax=Gellertiella hungarica TaxID=1572859 RepID=A0A7W6NK14_9HYPH|nr:crotonase/enoyl-CoA hydratase family protein [Gellertiella hungarica]MBB4064388.1 enoyl-CoA hydratase/carnithine racemase [Gellertiella hungarica]